MTARSAAPSGRSPRGLDAGDAALDEGVLDGHAVHLGIAGDGALLHVEAFALIGLHGGADAGVAEDA